MRGEERGEIEKSSLALCCAPCARSHPINGPDHRETCCRSHHRLRRGLRRPSRALRLRRQSGPGGGLPARPVGLAAAAGQGRPGRGGAPSSHRLEGPPRASRSMALPLGSAAQPQPGECTLIPGLPRGVMSVSQQLVSLAGERRGGWRPWPAAGVGRPAGGGADGGGQACRLAGDGTALLLCFHCLSSLTQCLSLRCSRPSRAGQTAWPGLPRWR